ncbi:helix-turn-helix domain-containing protein [Actinoallomurus sp. NBC_01490]|uniref:helix-turn-helix domain-containing protein n=1 Tax=Actinoallomurus sp. NBC_01490 TaxID=2903557 RepID=UPI002E3443A7|nr:helix-turn-helix transcriptional regulator [Actinoallomurus sp. NBC_01490]
MRRALARLDVGAVVAIMRAATGLSQLDFANIVEGWSQSTVSLIERGRRDTLYDVRELLRFADTVGMPREALLPLILGDPDAILGKDSGSKLAEGLEVDRRSFNAMAAGLTVGVALPFIPVPTRVDAAHVRYLRACLDQIRSRYRDAGGGAALEEALRHFARARAMLDESDYTTSIGRQLLVVTAELGEAAGWAAYDRNDQKLARQLYGEAELLAGSAEDAVVAVHVYTNLAQQSTYLARVTGRRGIARESLRFASRAAELARHEPSPRLHALIALRQALAHAELGDEIAFRSQITTARRELERGSHAADPAWAMFVSDSEITGYEALGYEAISRVQQVNNGRATALYRAVLDDPDRSTCDKAYYRARLADALLNDGDISLAITEGAVILPSMTGGQMTSARSLAELRPLRAAAEQASAEEFCVRFDAAVRALAA